jgi:tetratricopeptide (TPR) repeat protein
MQGAMNKQAVTTIISLSLVCVWAQQIAGAEPERKPKRSLAMTLPLAPAPHPVARPIARQKPLSQAMLRKKAAAAYPSTHFAKGQYYKSKGDVNAALVEFLKASQENPRLVRAFYEQALIFRQKHYLKLAESSLEQALAVKPDYQDARILLATIRIDQGDVGAAMKELSRSLGIGMPDTGQEKGTASSAVASHPQSSNKSPSQAAPNAVPSAASNAAAAEANSPLLSVEQLLGRAPAVLQSLHSTLSEIPFFAGTAPVKTNASKTLINTALTGSQPGVPDAAPATPGFSLRPYPPLPAKPAPSAATSASRSQHQGAARANQPLTKVAAATRSTKQKTSEPAAAKPKSENVDPTSPKPSEPTSNETKSGDDVFVVRIPKPLRFLWQHKQPSEDSAKEKQQKEKVAAKHDQPSTTGDAQADSDAKHNTDGHSWLSRFFRGTTDDTVSTGSTDSATHESTTNTSQNTDDANTGSTHAATGKQHVARKSKAVEEMKQFVLQPPTDGSDTTTSTTTAAAKTALTAKPLPLEPSPGNDNSANTNGKAAFAMPELPSASSSLLAPLSKMAQTEHANEDEWTKRLRYLSEHGTATLKEGEAFMFAEDTGEATLFLPDGKTIRRTIAPTRSEDEIVRERRPDMLIPDELMYNLSLLGKLMPKFGEQDKTDQSQSTPHSDTTANQSAEPNFNVDNLMGDSQGFWGWLQHIFKF